ncbi:NB-ARC domain-containing protein [Lentzea flaviverrucosa]|uniref:NB-ARC domain-containing protein n=1 Tax=Lentzea flaviverrucosa TaxID=200379 RepID=A0A1H9XS41_9PSEU|nr:NB-ARC domain-containing protein [Lentzea flaviverrucosa]RDI19348.1 NB-ARC domain-containing protein [Lentzea flaviverrucosa]SES48970.1 NB-ARC domain-containing protein [Lentzea flaviverrucosa]
MITPDGYSNHRAGGFAFVNQQTSVEHASIPGGRGHTSRENFAAGLAQLRVACGKPSYETLARLSGRLRRSTIFDALTGRSTPSLEFVIDYVRTCTVHAGRISAQVDAELSDLATWTARWRALHHVGEPVPQGMDASRPPSEYVIASQERVSREWPVPRQLPLGTSLLVGRDEEVERLDSVLDGGLVVVTGMAGVGKTALVTHWAHKRTCHFPDGVLWVDLDEDRVPGSPSATLISLLCALGMDRDLLPRSVTDLSHLLRSCTADRKVLIVIDGAEDPEQVRPLLPAESRCATVVISRRGLVGLSAREGADRLVVAPLSSTPAALLLTEVVRRAHPSEIRLDDRHAREIAALCGGLPLALRVAAERLRWDTAAQLREELSSEYLLLSGLVVADDPKNSPHAVLLSAIRRLPASAARVLRMLTLHPGATCTAPSVAALLGATAVETQREMRLLIQDNLLEQHGPSHFRMHVLVRRAAAELCSASETAEEQRSALRRLLTWFRSGAGLPVTEDAAPQQIDTAAAIAWLTARLRPDDHADGTL